MTPNGAHIVHPAPAIYRGDLDVAALQYQTPKETIRWVTDVVFTNEWGGALSPSSRSFLLRLRLRRLTLQLSG